MGFEKTEAIDVAPEDSLDEDFTYKESTFDNVSTAGILESLLVFLEFLMV